MLLLGNNYKQTVFRKKKLCSGKVTPGILSAIGKTRKKGVNRMVTGLETVGGGGSTSSGANKPMEKNDIYLQILKGYFLKDNGVYLFPFFKTEHLNWCLENEEIRSNRTACKTNSHTSSFLRRWEITGSTNRAIKKFIHCLAPSST